MAPTRSVGRRPFKPQTALLPRRTPVGSEVDLVSARQDKGVILSEPGFALAKEEGETAFGARRGESLFSRNDLWGASEGSQQNQFAVDFKEVAEK
jgi:hypothetical protein